MCGSGLMDTIKKAFQAKVVGGRADKVVYYVVLIGAFVFFILQLVSIFSNLTITKIEDEIVATIDAPESVTLCIPDGVFGADRVKNLEVQSGGVFVDPKDNGFGVIDININFEREGFNQTIVSFAQTIAPLSRVKTTGLRTFLRDAENSLTGEFNIAVCIEAKFSGAFNGTTSALVFGLVLSQGLTFFPNNSSDLGLPLTADLLIKLKNNPVKELVVPVSQRNWGNGLKLDITQETTNNKGKVSVNWNEFGLGVDIRPTRITRNTTMGTAECTTDDVNCQFLVFISPLSMLAKKITIKDASWGEVAALIGGAWSGAVLLITLVFKDVTPTPGGEEATPVMYKNRLRVNLKENLMDLGMRSSDQDAGSSSVALAPPKSGSS